MFSVYLVRMYYYGEKVVIEGWGRKRTRKGEICLN